MSIYILKIELKNDEDDNIVCHCWVAEREEDDLKKKERRRVNVFVCFTFDLIFVNWFGLTTSELSFNDSVVECDEIIELN